MIVNSSQNIQSNRNPLDSISSRRVNDYSRPSSTASDDEQKAEKAQKQQDDTVLRQLRARDREVRAHEGAHVAAGGSLVRGGPSFTLQRGPDGRSYAIGGEVQLDVSPVADDPAATLTKAGRIRNAALAPAEPSPQDRRVASNANQLASQARIDIAILRREEPQLNENRQTVDQVSAASDTTENSETDTTDELATSAVSPTNANTVTIPAEKLPGRNAPVAAISAFMATAQTESVPILLNQYA
jgi:SprA family protein